MRRTTGRIERTKVAGEEVAAFVPYPLAPSDPPLALDDEAQHLCATATENLQRLDLAAELVPSVDWFLYAFVRKEAVLSSQIEGTQATLMDLLELEANGDKSADAEVEEVCNYLEALNYAHKETSRPGGLPISVRLLCETHARLLRGVRGTAKQPGELRQSQNWIGGTRPGNAVFVPPPPHLVGELLAKLEHYIHGTDSLHPLVRIALVHAQFETIHPYLDGNGRLGRLLITLLLSHWELLREPLLYLSLFFKRHRSEYYRRLGAIRAEGDWEGWISFFLEGVATIATETVETARALHTRVTTDRQRVVTAPHTTVLAIRLFEQLPSHPILNVGRAMELLAASRPGAAKAIHVLEEASVLVETTGKGKNRSFGYKSYLQLLREGTELLHRRPDHA